MIKYAVVLLWILCGAANLAASVKVTVIGGNAETVYRALAGLPDIVPARWENAPAFAELNRDFVESRKRMPTTDFLVVADPDFNLAIFSISRSCQVAEFAWETEEPKSMEKIAGRLQKAIKNDPDEKALFVALSPEQGKVSDQKQLNAFVRHMENILLAEPDIQLIESTSGGKSIAENRFFLYHFPVPLDVYFTDLRVNGTSILLPSNFSYSSRARSTSFSYITHSSPNEISTENAEKICALIADFMKQEASKAWQPMENPERQIQLLRQHKFSGSAIKYWVKSVLAAPTEKDRRTLLLRMRDLLSQPRRKMYSKNHETIAALNKLQAKGIELPDRIVAIISLEREHQSLSMDNTPQQANQISVDWEIIKQYAKEIRKIDCKILRSASKTPYDPEKGIHSSAELNAYQLELMNIHHAQNYYVSYEDYKANVQKIIHWQFEIMDAFIVSGRASLPDDGRAIMSSFWPGMTIFANSSKEKSADAEPLWAYIETGKKARSKLMRQLALFWEFGRNYAQTAKTSEDYFRCYTDYCKAVQTLYQGEKPQLNVQRHPYPKLDISREEISKKHNAIASAIVKITPKSTPPIPPPPLIVVTASNPPPSVSKIPAPPSPPPVASAPAKKPSESTPTISRQPARASARSMPPPGPSFPKPKVIEAQPAENQRVIKFTRLTEPILKARKSQEAPFTLKELEDMVPLIHANMPQFWTDDPYLMLNYRQIAHRALENAEYRRVMDQFNAKVQIKDLVQLQGNRCILNSLMRGDKIYYVALHGTGEAIEFYCYNISSRKNEHLGTSTVNIRGNLPEQDTAGWFDVEGSYAVWMNPMDDLYAETKNGIKRNDDGYERIHVFNFSNRKTTIITDFPTEGIRATAILNGKVYVLLNGKSSNRLLLLRLSTEGLDRKVVFDTLREEPKNWFEQNGNDRGSTATLLSNPYRKKLLLVSSASLYEVDPDTLDASVFSTLTQARTSVLADKKLFCGLGEHYVVYNLDTGTMEHTLMKKTSDYKNKNELFSYIFDAAKVHFPISHGRIYAIQADILLEGEGSLAMYNLRDITQSPPIILLGPNVVATKVYPDRDGKTFILVLLDGRIVAVTPKL